MQMLNCRCNSGGDEGCPIELKQWLTFGGLKVVKFTECLSNKILYKKSILRNSIFAEFFLTNNRHIVDNSPEYLIGGRIEPSLLICENVQLIRFADLSGWKQIRVLIAKCFFRIGIIGELMDLFDPDTLTPKNIDNEEDTESRDTGELWLIARRGSLFSTLIF